MIRQLLGIRPPSSSKPWYVVVERLSMDLKTFPKGDIVIGPFSSETSARIHACDSADVDDWCYTEAKAQQYIVNDVYWTQNPEIPAHGINEPWVI